MFYNYDENLHIYGKTVPCEWDYSKKYSLKKDALSEKKRIYVHLYFNSEKAIDDEISFDKRISLLYNELKSDKTTEKHQKQYHQFFEVKASATETQVIVKEEALRDAKKYFGYFSLISNEKMDAFTALKLYRMKDVVEKAFCNVKDRLNMKRLLVSSERNLDGKLFVEFIALIFLSYINKQMQEEKLYKNYSMHRMLDKLDVIECFRYPNRELRVGEVLEKQKELYIKLGVAPPESSCV